MSEPRIERRTPEAKASRWGKPPLEGPRADFIGILLKLDLRVVKVLLRLFGQRSTDR